MNRAECNAHCANLPGSVHSDPWGGGHDCWKIGGKMYAVMGTVNAGVTLKCVDANTAAYLLDFGLAQKPSYLPRGNWVFVPWGSMATEELRDLLTSAYRTQRSKLPKRVQAELPALNPP